MGHSHWSILIFHFVVLHWTFFPKGIVGVFVDYSGYNNEYVQWICIFNVCFFINKNHIFTVLWFEKIDLRKKSRRSSKFN